MAPFLDGSDATLSEELPASESVVSPVEDEAAPLPPEPESLGSAPLPPEPESLGSAVIERGVLERWVLAAEEATEFASDSAAELAEAGEHSGECDTLGLVSSTFDSAAGLEAWGGDDTGGGDGTRGGDDAGGGDDTLTCEEASVSLMIGATALQLVPNTIRCDFDGLTHIPKPTQLGKRASCKSFGT